MPIGQALARAKAPVPQDQRRQQLQRLRREGAAGAYALRLAVCARARAQPDPTGRVDRPPPALIPDQYPRRAGAARLRRPLHPRDHADLPVRPDRRQRPDQRHQRHVGQLWAFRAAPPAPSRPRSASRCCRCCRSGLTLARNWPAQARRRRRHPIARGVQLLSATSLPELGGFRPRVTTTITDQISLTPPPDPLVGLRGAWLPGVRPTAAQHPTRPRPAR